MTEKKDLGKRIKRKAKKIEESQPGQQIETRRRWGDPAHAAWSPPDELKALQNKRASDFEEIKPVLDEMVNVLYPSPSSPLQVIEEKERARSERKITSPISPPLVYAAQLFLKSFVMLEETARQMGAQAILIKSAADMIGDDRIVAHTEIRENTASPARTRLVFRRKNGQPFPTEGITEKNASEFEISEIELMFNMSYALVRQFTFDELLDVVLQTGIGERLNTNFIVELKTLSEQEKERRYALIYNTAQEADLEILKQKLTAQRSVSDIDFLAFYVKQLQNELDARYDQAAAEEMAHVKYVFELEKTPEGILQLYKEGGTGGLSSIEEHTEHRLEIAAHAWPLEVLRRYHPNSNVRKLVEEQYAQQEELLKESTTQQTHEQKRDNKKKGSRRKKT